MKETFGSNKFWDDLSQSTPTVEFEKKAELIFSHVSSINKTETDNTLVFSSNEEHNTLSQAVKPKEIFLIPDVKAQKHKNYSTSIASFTGYVSSINSDNTFTAILHDNAFKSEVKEEAIFKFDLLDHEDRKDIYVGRMFYWNVGYSNKNGTIKRESYLRFKRLPAIDIDTEENAGLDNALDFYNRMKNIKWQD